MIGRGLDISRKYNLVTVSGTEPKGWMVRQDGAVDVSIHDSFTSFFKPQYRRTVSVKLKHRNIPAYVGAPHDLFGKPTFFEGPPHGHNMPRSP